ASRRPTLAWLGDLTLLHDLDGLEAAGNAGWPLTLVVVNNRGGGIFHQLPIAHHRGVFERLFATPRSARLAPLCEALGAHHQQVALAAGAFPEALRNAQQRPGLKLLEISVDRHHSVRRRRAALHACEQALHDWLSRRRQTPAAATDAALNREAAS
ncbi:MAG TPA: hypothetical protein ENK23_08300, partial [Sorangium sp.]|nr:hypothetical protein [Sorangium sp.]